ncbi:MAG: hypothetical protein J6V80_04420 [Clostridia bacterium]|nr:hypothetical protein [Clostridia bacterium]
MKRNLMLLLCVIAMVASCFVACNNGNKNQECTHTFSDVWYSDAEEHWHPATCEHAETERGALGAHTDADENGKCDVCEYEVGHSHTFSTTWSSDVTHHWKKSTCTHTDEKLQYSTHSDENMDGTCDVCAGHVHDANAAGYCKFCGEKVKDVDTTDLAALIEAIMVQSYLVNGGSMVYDFEGLSNTGSDFNAFKTDKVNYTYGKDNYTHVFVETQNVNGGINTNIPKTDAEPTIGENGNWWIGGIDTNVAVTTQSGVVTNTPYIGNNNNWFIGGVGTNGTLETWHQLSGEDQSFGVVSENGGATSLDISNAARLNGYYVALSTLAGDYGVEATLYALYQAAISDTTDDLIVTPGAEENTVTFKYTYNTVFVNATDIIYGDNVGSKVYNVNHFDVEVTLGYSNELALTYLNILVYCYTNDPGTADGIGFLYDDVDIQYDPETDTVTFVKYNHETGTYEPCDNPTPDVYTITVNQTLGDRTEENPKPKDNFIPTRFDVYATKEPLYDENDLEIGYTLKDKISAPISVRVGDIVNIYISNYYPENTSLHYVADLVTFKLYKDGVEVENPDDILENPSPIAAAVFTFSGELRSFFVIPKVDGVFKLEIYVMGQLKKDVSIIAGVVDEGDIELDENSQFAVKVTETYAWTNEVSFTASQTGKYYFNLPSGVGFMDADMYDAAGENPTDELNAYFDYQTAEKNPDGTYKPGSFSLDLEAGQTIRFYVNSTRKGTYVIRFACVPTE